VVDLDATEGAVWVATNGGLAQVQEGRVTHTWGHRDGLPDDYTQAVYADRDAVWAGTYRGLAQVRGDAVSIVLAPWSCFSLLRGPDQRVWVGYKGLRGLPDGEPIEGVDPALRVFDAVPLLRGVWLASDEQGLLWLEDGVVTPVFVPEGGAVYGIADLPTGVMVAAGDDGVWQRVEGSWVHHGVDVGLPSPVANTVALGPRDKAWVGTDRGIALLDPAGRASALPLAPLAAGVAVQHVAQGRAGFAVAAEDGLVWLGRRPPRGWTSFAAAAGAPVHRLLTLGREWWAITDDAAFHLDPRGRVARGGPRYDNRCPPVDARCDPALLDATAARPAGHPCRLRRGPVGGDLQRGGPARARQRAALAQHPQPPGRDHQRRRGLGGVRRRTVRHRPHR